MLLIASNNLEEVGNLLYSCINLVAKNYISLYFGLTFVPKQVPFLVSTGVLRQYDTDIVAIDTIAICPCFLVSLLGKFGIGVTFQYPFCAFVHSWNNGDILSY